MGILTPGVLPAWRATDVRRRPHDGLRRRRLPAAPLRRARDRDGAMAFPRVVLESAGMPITSRTELDNISQIQHITRGERTAAERIYVCIYIYIYIYIYMYIVCLSAAISSSCYSKVLQQSYHK